MTGYLLSSLSLSSRNQTSDVEFSSQHPLYFKLEHEAIDIHSAFTLYGEIKNVNLIHNNLYNCRAGVHIIKYVDATVRALRAMSRRF